MAAEFGTIVDSDHKDRTVTSSEVLGASKHLSLGWAKRKPSRNLSSFGGSFASDLQRSISSLDDMPATVPEASTESTATAPEASTESAADSESAAESSKSSKGKQLRQSKVARAKSFILNRLTGRAAKPARASTLGMAAQQPTSLFAQQRSAATMAPPDENVDHLATVPAEPGEPPPPFLSRHPYRESCSQPSSRQESDASMQQQNSIASVEASEVEDRGESAVMNRLTKSVSSLFSVGGSFVAEELPTEFGGAAKQATPPIIPKPKLTTSDSAGSEILEEKMSQAELPAALGSRGEGKNDTSPAAYTSDHGGVECGHMGADRPTSESVHAGVEEEDTLGLVSGTRADLLHTIDLCELESIVREQATRTGDPNPEDAIDEASEPEEQPAALRPECEAAASAASAAVTVSAAASLSASAASMANTMATGAVNGTAGGATASAMAVVGAMADGSPAGGEFSLVELVHLLDEREQRELHSRAKGSDAQPSMQAEMQPAMTAAVAAAAAADSLPNLPLPPQPPLPQPPLPQPPLLQPPLLQPPGALGAPPLHASSAEGTPLSAASLPALFAGASTASSAVVRKDNKEGKEARARNTMGRKDWSAHEDRTILAEVQKVGQKWRIIAAHPDLPGRSDDAVRNRWKRLIGEKGGSAAADVEEVGEEASGGSKDGRGGGGKSKAKVTERLAWSREEDDLIVRSVQQLGLKWGRISQQLPGRTAHAIRNRFHRLQVLQVEQAAAAAAGKGAADQ